MVNATGRRFVDEGADFRNYTYAKYGRAVLEQPGQFAWQVFDAKVTHLLRDEYRIRQITKAEANTLEELAGKLEGVDGQAFIEEMAAYNAAVDQATPFSPNVKDGRATRGLAVNKSNWANVLDEPPFIAFQITCGVTFTFGGLRVDTARFYAERALEAGVALVNCIPVFIASDPEFAQRFADKGLPIVGDDIKAQLGATITHRVLTDLFHKRGVKLERTYQLNTGGNTDFLNMLNRNRLASKKESKTEAVQSVAAKRIDDENIHVGPSDYVAWQNDNKVCFLRMEGKLFGDVPMNIELRLSVEDSPNSAGVSIDAIRCAKLALDKGVGGPLLSPSSYFMKHPPEQYTDDEAHTRTEDFIAGRRDA